MTTFTPNITLPEQVPLDTSTTNIWGGVLNTGLVLADSAIAGILPLSVAGSANVTLTLALGAADQERNQHFIFSGLLTGSIIVLYPAGRTKTFSVENTTTGNFTLSVGVSNGAGGAAGTTVIVPQNAGSAEYISDGTNCRARCLSLPGNVLVTGTLTTNQPAILGVFATASLPAATAGARAFVNDSSGTFQANNVGQIVIGGGAFLSPVYADGTNWRYG